jgi:DNA invertase Pin-like site-specific DNA recombinase
MLGNTLEEILDKLKAIFENGTSLVYPDRFSLKTVSEFNHFEISFFYLVSQAIKNAHKEKIKEGIDLAKSEGRIRIYHSDRKYIRL